MKKLAKKHHDGQFRKGEGNIPYIVHPQAVAETLINWGESEDSNAVKIAWGHDLLEDTQVTESEIISASSEEVLQAIKMLTCPEGMEKMQYLQSVAASGRRNVLLVKIADRICNTRDFIQLKGEAHAYQYMHKADVLLPALEKLSGDKVVQNALTAWHALDSMISKYA